MRCLLVLGSCCVTLFGCREQNPIWMQQSSDGQTHGTSASGETEAESGAQTTDPPVMCEQSLGGAAGPCPDACDGCQGSLCRIECAGTSACRDETITCPEGRRCEVSCDGESACEDTVIRCPPDADCTIACKGEDSCQDAQILCGAAPCSLRCDTDPDSCQRTRFACGSAASSVTCDVPQEVELVRDESSACDCAAQGCD